MKFYGDNLIFELFLYPYFKRETIAADSFDLPVRLLNYVHDCCEQLDLALFPVTIPKYSWNKIPGKDEPRLLTSLKENLALEGIDKDNTHIEKTPDDSAIKIITPQIRIIIKLDQARGKAIASVYDVENNYRTYQYEIVRFGSEIIVSTIRPPEESLKNGVHTRKLIEVPVYELVSNIGRELVSNIERRSTVLRDEMDSNKVLAQDEKFMALLENIHKDMHDNFEKGYETLRELSQKYI